jgi:hypothetical protein
VRNIAEAETVEPVEALLQWNVNDKLEDVDTTP